MPSWLLLPPLPAGARMLTGPRRMARRLEARLNRTRQKLDEALAQAAELRGSGRANTGASGSRPLPQQRQRLARGRVTNPWLSPRDAVRPLAMCFLALIFAMYLLKLPVTLHIQEHDGTVTLLKILLTLLAS